MPRQSLLCDVLPVSARDTPATKIYPFSRNVPAQEAALSCGNSTVPYHLPADTETTGLLKKWAYLRVLHVKPHSHMWPDVPHWSWLKGLGSHGQENAGHHSRRLPTPL